jgi:putative transposase
LGGKGRRHDEALREEALALLEEGSAQGARLAQCCAALGISLRSLQRWKHGTSDGRRGPNRAPSHQLTEAEKDDIVRLANTPQCRNLSPEQVVARLADEGVYICSERSLRRVLAERRLDRHRQRSKPSSARRKPRSHVATGPMQVVSWDITYMKNVAVRGSYFYLYLFIDIWSRRIVGAEVHDSQQTELAAKLLASVCVKHSVQAEKLVLHSDNGAPMKGSTMLATMQALGITPSFSRPGVSDDNAFVEALFRHLKYAPSYPRDGFHSLEQARAWAQRFVAWYNTEHLHSAIGYVTPDDRHHGRDIALLEQRREVYRVAQQRHPRRWTRAARSWERIASVTLNPERSPSIAPQIVAA